MPNKQTDTERFEALFNAHRGAILAYAVRRTDSAEEAADVVAESFATAWRKLDSVPDGDRALPWLYATARNTLANAHRSGTRRDSLTVRATNELVVALDVEMRRSLDFGPKAELSDDARAALATLNEVEREALILFAWEGLKPSEIGQVLGINPATARTRLHRAKRRFSAALESTPTTARAPLTASTGQEEI